MTIATFRFYAELNDFLAPEHRGLAFEHPCARAATAKHEIEALGVPHTEVEFLLINDAACGLGRLLSDRDRVAVYPRFRHIALDAAAGIQPPLADPIRFIADAHLGGLARLLRMAGFDTLYENNFQDAYIELIAAREQRIVLSRDIELLKRRSLVHGAYVRALKPARQFSEIVERFHLRSTHPFSLCLDCNAALRPISPEAARDRVPPNVQATHHRFSTCSVCKRVFWEGSHWKSMQRLLDDTMQAAHTRGAPVRMPP
ncbi:MAG TPA: Mut7-C RNAse domain-containing protein, partial [Burkholderiaceae bacterium]|nr:Mut7-C RNAse domain-containing protein [Burkholderiaceae bacterium]